MKKALFALLPFFLISALLSNRNAKSQEADFDTTYNIEYQVDTSLTVSVKENIAIINQNASAVPSSFIETITNISIFDIKIVDSENNSIEPGVDIKEGAKETVVTIPIEDPAVGVDKKTEITLMYKTKDLASKTGRILSLHIPKAPVSNFMQEYNIYIKIPKDFGPQISVTPKPIQEKMEEEGYTLIYNKQTLEKYGISATFGDYQIFDFEMRYKLTNPSIFTQSIEVALPSPVKEYQQITLNNIVPKPVKMTKDKDGNVLAYFKVGSKKSLDVLITGKAKTETRKIDPEKSAPFTKKLPTDLNVYLQPQKYWESKDKEMVEVAKSLFSKEKSVEQNALAIYTYITKNILYDFNSSESGTILERKGGLQTLRDKKGTCLDFTDLFISITRASGIPSKEVNGYAYSKESGSGLLLHSWAQFYSPEHGWIFVDPAWGTTSGLDYFSKLDNNHLAFVIKGVDSETPQALGTYKVNFSSDDFFNKDSPYDLDNLPEEGLNKLSSVSVGVFAAVLGLCTILALLKVHPKSRYK